LQLLKAGKTVVAAARDGKRASSVFEGEMGLKAGLQSGGGALIIDSGVDITSSATLGESLWKGVTQVDVPLSCRGTPLFTVSLSPPSSSPSAHFHHKSPKNRVIFMCPP
jgi:hypothetical protein